MNTVSPGSLRSVAVPPCASATAVTMARPSPVPPPAPAWPGPVAVGEAFEDPVADLLRDAGTVVPYRQRHPELVGVDAGGDPGAGRGVQAGVGQEVGDGLVEAVRVARDGDRFFRELHDPAVVRTRRPGVGDRVEHEAREVDRLAFQGSARVQAGEQEQVLDHLAHPSGLRGDALQCTADLGGYGAPVQEGEFRVAADGGDRGAQLVAGVGGEAAQAFLGSVPAGERVLDVAEHAVEGGRHLADLAARVRLGGARGQDHRAARERQFADSGGGGGDPAQRAQGPAHPEGAA